MSVFSNKYDNAREEGDAYTRALLELLGDQDPRHILSYTPIEFERAVDDFESAILRRPEAPGKWSLLELCQHMADSELVWAWRLRKVVAEDKPTIEGYDQDLWAKRLRYNNTTRLRALTQFRLMREINLDLLNELEPEEFQRVGVHTERGEESIEHMIKLYAAHDLVHRRQLERIIATVTK